MKMENLFLGLTAIIGSIMLWIALNAVMAEGMLMAAGMLIVGSISTFYALGSLFSKGN